MVEIALNYLKCDKENAVYIGDTDVDFLTAKNSGLDCILVSWGFRGADFIKKYDANYFVDSPKEILDI